MADLTRSRVGGRRADAKIQTEGGQVLPSSSFRPAVLAFLDSIGERGARFEAIESEVRGHLHGPQGGSIELDTASLLEEGLIETADDFRMYRLSDLGRTLTHLAGD